jgi:deoxyribose-phosphate aldolase
MNIAQYIDHTNLKPDCDEDAIHQLCDEAKEHNFYSVCVPPYFLDLAKQELLDFPAKTATVIGFPIGYDHIQAKESSILKSIQSGVDELDVVLNVAAIKSSHWSYIQKELSVFNSLAVEYDKLLKVIFETGLLTHDEIEHVCGLCNEEEPAFVKTSTGFFGEGANTEIIKLMRRNLRTNIKIKASGGIREYGAALQLIRSGADRLGCSASVKIVAESLL